MVINIFHVTVLGVIYIVFTNPEKEHIELFLW